MAEPIGYRLLRGFFHFWVARFFRRIEVRGMENVPPGPVILAMNHPNNLVDSLIIEYIMERKVHFLGTGVMFRNKILAVLLTNAGVIPIYRKQDATDHSARNVSTFQACYDVLRNGGVIGIYPEGTTHSEPRLKQIKTGAARIALETEQQFEPGVQVVPIGLNYSARKAFRGEVLVSIGSPFSVAPYLPRYETNPTEAVDALTLDLQDAIEEEIIHIDAPELDQFIKDIEQIYKGELIHDLLETGTEPEEVDRFRLSKKLVEGIHFFNRRDPSRIIQIREKTNRYMSLLNEARLQDRILHDFEREPASLVSLLARTFLFVLGAPLAFWGGLNYFLPYHLTRRISRKLTSREADYATARILSAIILYTVFYFAQVYLVLRWFGVTAALVYGLTLPFFGAFAYYYRERFRLFSGRLRLLWIMLTRKQLLQQIKEHRVSVILEMDRAKEDFLAQD